MHHQFDSVRQDISEERPSRKSFVVDPNCVKCGACASDCPVQCIRRGSDRFIIESGCIGCGDCQTICPVGAIHILAR